MTIKQLQVICHQLATDKGFWEGDRNMGELLMLIVSELGEALEALRKDKRQDNYFTYLGDKCEYVWKKDTFEDELADVAIRLFDLAEAEGVNLTWQIEQKLEYNKTRPPKHGKLF